MEPRQLRYFVAVVEAGSMGRAAALLKWAIETRQPNRLQLGPD